MSDWDFGGAFADTAGKLRQQEQSKQAFPLELQNLQARTRLNNAQAGIEEHSLKARQDFSAASQGFQAEPGESLSNQFSRRATLAYRAGDTPAGNALMQHAGQLAVQEDMMKTREETRKKAEVDLTIKKSTTFADLHKNDKNDADFQRGNMIWTSMFHEPVPFPHYSPELVKTLVSGAQTLAQQETERWHNEELAARAADRAQRAASHAETMEQERLNRDLREREFKARKKEGGASIGEPSDGEKKDSRGLLEQQKKLEGYDEPTRARAATELADRTKGLMYKSGMTAEEARAKALIEMEKDGYFETKVTKKPWYKGGDTKTKAYGKPGATQDRPLSLPTDPTKLQKDRYYVNDKGVVGLYQGGGKFKAVNKPDGKSDDAPDDESGRN